MSTNDTTPLIHLGIDVAKDSLQVDTILPGGPAATPNTPAAIRSLIKRIGAWQGKSASLVHVVCEASGGYERLLQRACGSNGGT